MTPIVAKQAVALIPNNMGLLGVIGLLLVYLIITKVKELLDSRKDAEFKTEVALVAQNQETVMTDLAEIKKDSKASHKTIFEMLNDHERRIPHAN